MNPIREAMMSLPGNWGRGKYVNNDGSYCGLGHVARIMSLHSGKEFWDIVSDDDSFYDISKFMNDAATEQYPGLNGFAHFNDEVAKDENEVLAVMEKAAIKFDETQGLTD